MKAVYLSLAVVGAVVPGAFFAAHFAGNGYGLIAFLEAVSATPAASGFAADVLISSVALWAFLFASGDGRRAWLIVPLNLFIGLSCALPVYLYLRLRAA
ncbi:MAG: DUF2834 domain-containing protein [Pseudomonadales bacterium]